VLEPVDALRQHAREVALPGAEHLRHGLHATRHFREQAREVGHLVVHLPRALRRLRGLDPALAPAFGKKDGDEEEQERGRARDGEGRLGHGHGVSREDEKGSGHGATLADSREQSVNEGQ
jgi:hypothetical protein